jgi:hypothetical protein
MFESVAFMKLADSFGDHSCVNFSAAAEAGPA